jgi:hypothetical protein
MRNCGRHVEIIREGRWERGQGELWKGRRRRGRGELWKDTHDHTDVLSGAWLDAARGLRRARLGPVCIV